MEAYIIVDDVEQGDRAVQGVRRLECGRKSLGTIVITVETLPMSPFSWNNSKRRAEHGQSIQYDKLAKPTSQNGRRRFKPVVNYFKRK